MFFFVYSELYYAVISLSRRNVLNLGVFRQVRKGTNGSSSVLCILHRTAQYYKYSTVLPYSTYVTWTCLKAGKNGAYGSSSVDYCTTTQNYTYVT